MKTIEPYLTAVLHGLRDAFGSRLCYLGLQGSYLRGEATDESDIDLMIVLDTLNRDDLAICRRVLHDANPPAKPCGFLCDRVSLQNWNRLELCHLVHTTKDLWGTLRPLVMDYTRDDVVQDIKLMTGNLYHLLCHSMVFGEGLSTELLHLCEKQVFYILQNLAWLETGHFPATQAAVSSLPGEVYEILREKNLEHKTISQRADVLLKWCQRILQQN